MRWATSRTRTNGRSPAEGPTSRDEDECDVLARHGSEVRQARVAELGDHLRHLGSSVAERPSARRKRGLDRRTGGPRAERREPAGLIEVAQPGRAGQTGVGGGTVSVAVTGPGDFAIERKLKRVEAGAQGEHKIQRGYLPSPTYSAHWIEHRGLRRAVGDFLERERPAMRHEMEVLAEMSPFKRDGEGD